MTLAHDRTGSGAPLILVHGFGSQRLAWRLITPLLSSEREVIAVDLPGFGDSPASVEDPTPPRLAEAVARFMDELGLDRAHVAGYSMGGWIALELNKMGRTLSACALCPAGFWNRWERAYCKGSLRNLRAATKALLPLLPRLARNDGARRALALQIYEHGEHLTPDELVAMSRNLVEAPGYGPTLQALHAGHFTGGRDVTEPVTVAWGDKDKLLLPRQAERARRAIPQARHLWLPGCGHSPMVDDPETTARAILTSG